MPTVTLSLGKFSYDVHVLNGALDNLGGLVHRNRLTGHAAIITDSNVVRHYAERARASLEDAGYTTSLHIVDAGEQSKSLATVEVLSSELVQAGLDRSGFIIALGGGVVGDLSGFIASIYYRGIPFVQVPTTIMAQVDSSVGGKTAVNIPAGKNLVGTFHQPRLVVVDPLTLTTLPSRVIREGMAEMVKHAAIRDAAMLAPIRALAKEIDLGFTLSTIEQLPDIIARNIAIKARVVEEDEKETKDVRAFLNFGHTLGHGIEAAVPYGELLHGEVVALGMRAALYLSEKYAGLPRQSAEEILSTLKELDLPLTLPDGIDPKTIIEKTLTDKKFREGTIRFVLLEEPGKPVISEDITLDDLREALALLLQPA